MDWSSVIKPYFIRCIYTPVRSIISILDQQKILFNYTSVNIIWTTVILDIYILV